jgi:predicted nucleic acid-binding protein
LTVYYADTSALGKRYFIETGSAWLASLFDPATGNLIVVSELVVVEMMSLFARRLREGALASTDFLHIKADFLFHLSAEYNVIPVNSSILIHASNLVLKHPLRSLDAVQLASAINAVGATKTTPAFISADRRLLAAAAIEGFPIDDPNAHP